MYPRAKERPQFNASRFAFMKTYGIIGYPLEHSRSPQYFNEYFREAHLPATYLPFEIQDIRQLGELLKQYPELEGFNVTIPHKQSILPYLDEISKEASSIGAVNCVRVDRTQGRIRLCGYNTDMYGFRKSLLAFLPEGITKALILGNGGAARAVRYALQTLNIQSLTVSRTPGQNDEIGYGETGRYIPDYRLIVNTTPLGTWPATEGFPDIPYHLLTPGHYLFDLVYNPEVTLFMHKGSNAGAHTCNGYGMWMGQAQKNREIWGI